MATEAETLLAGTGWLPEPLRTPGRTQTCVNDAVEPGDAAAPDSAVADSAANGGETAMADELASDDTEDARSRAIAAE